MISTHCGQTSNDESSNDEKHMENCDRKFKEQIRPMPWNDTERKERTAERRENDRKVVNDQVNEENLFPGRPLTPDFHSFCPCLDARATDGSQCTYRYHLIWSSIDHLIELQNESGRSLRITGLLLSRKDSAMAGFHAFFCRHGGNDGWMKRSSIAEENELECSLGFAREWFLPLAAIPFA